jgi:rod shape-determining protein MreC
MLARLDSGRSRALVFVCLLLIAAAGLDMWQETARRAGGHTWLDNAVGLAAAPLQRAITGAIAAVERAWRVIAENRRLTEQNALLSVEVQDLQAKVTRLEEDYARAARESGLRAAYPGTEGRSLLAHVIGVGYGGWLSYLVLDRGSADGVKPQDVAVTGEGVVGQVYSATERTARVLPITDPASGVAVRVQRSRETGILKGLGDWECEVRYLPPEADVRPGDRLLTAGTGGVFPKGLRVGTVTWVDTDRSAPGKVAGVKLAADLRKVEEVLLVRAEPIEPTGGADVPHR